MVLLGSVGVFTALNWFCWVVLVFHSAETVLQETVGVLRRRIFYFLFFIFLLDSVDVLMWTLAVGGDCGSETCC